jgi:hypothetical protein
VQAGWLALGLILFVSAGVAPTGAQCDDTISPDLIRRVELEWELLDNAIAYEFQLALRADFGDGVLRSERLKTTRYALDLLPGTYYYRVRGIDRNGRPGEWTNTAEVSLNPRPPVLISPPNGTIIRGNLSDRGIPLEWRTSGPGVRYLVEIRAADEAGAFTRTVAKQEWDETVFPFFPEEPGRFQWNVHTIGAAGDEPGTTWELAVEGVYPRLAKAPPGTQLKRVVRYVAPWWRKHWTLLARYGQTALSYEVVDQDLRAASSFSGIAGYANLTLNWEWHDPVDSLRGGIPWWELEFELDRLSVLAESVVLPKAVVRWGAWYDEWAEGWRFSPTFEAGRRNIAIYQPRRTTEAARATSTRTHVGVGLSAEYKVRPFLTVGASARFRLDFGGDAGLAVLSDQGDEFDINKRAGTLASAQGLEGILSGTMFLSPRMFAQGRLRYDTASGSWTPIFPLEAGGPGGTDSTFSMRNLSFDVTFGYKF